MIHNKRKIISNVEQGYNKQVQEDIDPVKGKITPGSEDTDQDQGKPKHEWE